MRLSAQALRVLWGFVVVSIAWTPSAIADDSRFVPPPGDETPEIRAVIDRAKAALDERTTIDDILINNSFMAAHPWPRFRMLIRENAPIGLLTMASSREPGDRLQLQGSVKDSDGQPISGALIYVYHTSAKGWYSDQAAHIGGNSGDMKHARLYGYLKSDSKGRYEIRTVRPGGYPETDLPAHIHVHIDVAGSRPRSLVTEIRFDDDPRLTKEWRERSRREGDLVCTVKHESNHTQSVVADFVLR